MRHAGCLKEFIRYAVLNMLGMTALSCYILADTFFVAGGRWADGPESGNSHLQFYPWQRSDAWHGRGHQILHSEKPGENKRRRSCFHPDNVYGSDSGSDVPGGRTFWCTGNCRAHGSRRGNP